MDGGYALGIVPAMGLGALTSAAEAQPFAYVTPPDSSFNSVTVIDMATNTPVTTIPVGSGPFGVTVTLGGKQVYVTFVTRRTFGDRHGHQHGGDDGRSGESPLWETD